MNNSTLKLAFVGALVGSLIVSCEATPEPRLEASASDVEVASATVAQTEPAPGIDTRPDIYMLDPETGSVAPFLTAPGAQTNGEVSPDGERVVYESRAPGFPSQIFVLEADGTKRKLTDMQGVASDPTWSPDGSQIAFAGTRRRDGDPRPDADIFVMNADGSHIKRLAGTSRPDGNPDWSPDGSRIAFHSRYGHRGVPYGVIRVASVRTRAVTRLTRDNVVAAVDPAWSPDGRWLAYSSLDRHTMNGRIHAAELWLMRPDGTHKRRIGRPVSFWDLRANPNWSPDGHSIVFERTPSQLEDDRLLVVDLRTGRMRTILAGAGAGPSWSKEGILVSLS